MEILFEMALFAVMGLGLECVGTAILDWKKDPKRHLLGFSSLWYLPLYCVTPLFFKAFGAYFFPLPMIVRGILYMLIIWVVEYPSMWVIRKLVGSSPSEASYYQSKWGVHGLIRLDLGPAWLAAGLALEFLYRGLHSGVLTPL